jgi:bifunctional ADP-heptose synthase (sugar kinase/adenylyltransferase)
LLVTTSRRTPVYTKCLAADTLLERQRFDIKNREPLPEALQDALLQRVEERLEAVDGVAILDQVQEANCGVITDKTREELNRLAQGHREKAFLADSRTRILDFRNVIIKPNRFEAAAALNRDEVDVEGLLRELGIRTGRPVLVTAGAEGIWLLEKEQLRNLPALPVSGPTDIVGAGDSVSAAVISGLSVGASLSEAAQLANLVASVTVQKLGTTGTASPKEVWQTAGKHCELLESW